MARNPQIRDLPLSSSQAVGLCDRAAGEQPAIPPEHTHTHIMLLTHAHCLILGGVDDKLLN